MHPRHKSFGDACCDEQQTLNFELNFLCVDMFPHEDSKILSVSLYPKKKKSPYMLFTGYYSTNSMPASLIANLIFLRKNMFMQPECFCCHVLLTIFSLYCAH